MCTFATSDNFGIVTVLMASNFVPPVTAIAFIFSL